ncbi:MAG: TolC family protein [Candidatus Omnitrophota bacterium]|nr:TolC family protein [Candidatus Omnitrophota bacterium]
MLTHSNNFKPSFFLLLSGVFFWLLFLSAIDYRGASLAADSADRENRSDREEIKLETTGLEDRGAAEEEITIPENGASKKEIEAPPNERTISASPDSGLLLITENETKNKKEKIMTKQVFTRELGLIDVPIKGKEGWGILSLDECIAIAVKNHLPLQIAEKSMKLAEMRVFEARRNMLPSVTLLFEEGTGRVNARAYVTRKQYIEGQQPIFHGGELYYTMKQTEVNLQITKTDYQKIKNELVLQVKKAYYTLAKTKGNLKLQTELSKEVEKILNMMRKQFEAGVSSKLEFLNVNSQSSQVKYQLTAARGDVSVAELILKQAINIDPRDRIDIADGILEFKKIAVDFESVLTAAFLNRPEMKINSLMVDYYNYAKGIAKAKGWPKVDLLGQWGLAKDEYASPDQLPGDNRKMWQQWYAGVKTSMPFWGSTGEYVWIREQWAPAVSTYQGTEANTSTYKFKFLDKLDYYSDKKLAEIDFDKARQEFNKIRQDIVLEARESCFGYEKAVMQVDTALNKVKYQESDLEFTRMKRGMDEAQDSNVIESMIKLAQEKFGCLQALAECHTSLASINKAIGIEDYFKTDSI